MAVSVYRRDGSPFYWFNVPASYTTSGKRLRKSTEREGKRDAEKVAEEYLRRLLDRKQLGEGVQELTFREAIFDHYLPTKVGAASYRDLARNANKVVGEWPGVEGIAKGDLPFHELTTSMIRQYRTRRLAQGVSPQTVDHEVKVVSAAYHLVQDDYRVRQGLKFPMDRPKGKPRPLTAEEEKALLKDLDPRRALPTRGGHEYFLDVAAKAYKQRQDNYDLALMLLDTGARFSEIAHLTWDAVDTITWSWVHIYREKVKNEGKLATTKRMQELLQRRWKDRGNSYYVFPGWKDQSKDGDEPRSSTQAIRRAMARIGINHPIKVKRYGRRDVRSLRDTFATKLRMRGLALSDLQPLLGHASMQMTMKYADVTVDVASERAVALLDQEEAA
jgi:integrase